MNRIGFCLFVLLVLLLLLAIFQLERPGRFAAFIVFGVVWLLVLIYKFAIKKDASKKEVE